jgi:gliding motility-associated-like protein
MIDYYIPNAFTPNDDGINDRFEIFSSNPLMIESLEIFDRWGSRVFQARNILSDQELGKWDGRINGEKAAKGTYVYKITIRYSDDESNLEKGEINLLR